MNVNYEAYKYFYSVATEESISKAAEKLHVSQPAVTWQIKALEEQLDIALFNRNKKGVTLTKEGEVLFSYIKNGVECFNNGEKMLANMKNLNYGSITIGASTTVSKHVLMPYLEIFHEKYPNIEIKIVNALTKNLIQDLRHGNIDMLVLNLPMQEKKGLKIYKVMDVQDIFVGNQKYYQQTNGKINIQDLKKYPLLFQKRPSNTREFLDNYLKRNQVYLNPTTEIVSYNLIMDFIKSGFGIGYATKEFIKDDLNKTLFEIEVTPKIPARYIGVATLDKAIPNYSAKKLLDLMLQKNI